MKKYGIPTAEYQVFTDAGAAMDYVKTCPLPVVVKADGLALGKGVLIAEDRAAAVAAVETIMLDRAFGNSGGQVVIEEFLTGPEVSVLAFTDGKTVVPMVSSMDHKRAHDHGEGLNTGGMGTVAPNPYYTDDIARTCMDTIFLPTMRAMNAEGRTFRGCLYFGLMLTNGGRVLGVTATAQDLRSAVEKAYTMVQSVQFDNAFYRHDIGQRALKALEQ